LDLAFLNRDGVVTADVTHTATAQDLEDAIATDVDRVFAAIDETLVQSGLDKQQINTVFTTGGSTALPSVKALVQQRFPAANWVSGDLFNSVGKGLVLEAQRRYR